VTIVLLTIGTRGDVQPFVALGLRLRERGHRVRICTCERFKEFITSHGLEYGCLDDGLLQFIESDRVREMIGSRRNNIFQWVRAAIEMLPQVKEMQRRMLVDQWNACRDADLLLFHPKALGGVHIAEKLGIPGFYVPPFPAYVPTREFPLFILSVRSGGGWLNRLSYSVTRRGQAAIAGIVNDFRTKHLELPARGRFSLEPGRLDGKPIPVMHPISPQVLPRPADWPEHVAMTGYWFLDATDGWTPPDELARFLESGTPPVYIGFGSMVTRRPEEIAQVVLRAIELLGVRAILGRGWGGLQPATVPENVHLVDDVPHDRLLPHCAAVVHHGGAGSTAAGLRAGCPTLVVPHFADQPLWGKRVHDLGVGPPPLSKKELRPETLAERIGGMLQDESMQGAARELGARIRSESGTTAAIEFMNRFGASI